MIEQTQTYYKSPVATGPQLASAGTMSQLSGSAGLPNLQPKKKNTRKTLALAGGVLAFLILAIGGVYIALLQRTSDEVATPNAPQSRPDAAVAISNCSLTFTVAAVASPSPTPTATPSATPTATPSATPSPSPTYACDSTCTSDAQCQSVNADYVCSAAAGNRCRLATNTGSASCTPAAGTYACNSVCETNAQCGTADGNYVCATVGTEKRCRLATNLDAANCQAVQPTPTPVVGCNVSCTTNSDCANPDHICYNGQCRLSTYPTSSTCTIPGGSTSTTTATQPTLPSELPQSGAADWGLWLKAGLGILGVGAILLLFL